MREIEIPHNSLVLLVGPAGSGKSTFAASHFRESEVVSSDLCRQMVSDNMEDMSCSNLAFRLFHNWIDYRLQLGRLTVADATSLTDRARSELRDVARKHGAPTVVFALETPLDLCKQQNGERTRYVPEHVIEHHHKKASEVIPNLEAEGYGAIHRVVPRIEELRVLATRGEAKYTATGYDVIGDIHGCYDELVELVRNRLGYRVDFEPAPKLSHPQGRRLVFVGDFTDRGPENVKVLRFIQNALIDGHLAVRGNHDDKLRRALKGNKVKVAHGLQGTLDQLATESPADEQAEFLALLESLPYYLQLQVAGKPDLVVCHAGMPRDMVGRDGGAVKSHCLYGETTGQVNEEGYPMRGSGYMDSWAAGNGDPVLVHGHTPVPTPYPTKFVNVVNVDQGCVFGGRLTAFRYPEVQFSQVDAVREYAPRYPNKQA